jgi:polysaccharide biosynthesis protein PslG
MPTRRWPLLLCACAALAGCGGSEQPSGPAKPRGYFGLNAQYLQAFPTVGRDGDLAVHTQSVASLGVDFTRANLDWRILEPAPPGPTGHAYNFATTDAWVAALAREGLRWQVTGQGGPTPVWARPAAKEAVGCVFIAPPSDPRDFGALMAAIARRYGPDGAFWEAHPELPQRPIHQYEIWNEPNFANFWCPEPDPEAYGELYAVARSAILRADPKAQVVYGGLAAFRATASPTSDQMPADEFLERSLAAMPPGRREVDVLAVHPYGQTPAEVMETLGWFRDLADRAGLEGVPLSANEIGWRTAGQGSAPLADEQTRAENMAAVIPAIAASRCNVIAVAPHTWITYEQNPVDPEHWYGLADPMTAEPYPTAEAYADAVDAIVAGEEPSMASKALGDPCD